MVHDRGPDIAISMFRDGGPLFSHSFGLDSFPIYSSNGLCLRPQFAVLMAWDKGLYIGIIMVFNRGPYVSIIKVCNRGSHLTIILA
jgi:hypothetical protein